MGELKIPGQSPVVDFDYFDLGGCNYQKAEQLSAILVAHANVDDLHGYNDQEGRYFASTVGTGGSGMNMACGSQGAQRACLASHFARYAHRHYVSCDLALAEYGCLWELLEVFDYVPEHRQPLIDEHRALVQQVCRQFEIAYTKKVPEFLFTVLRNHQ